MDNDTITLILGVTLGLTIVGVAIGLLLMLSNARQAAPQVVLSNPSYSAVNDERWSVVKDADGRVRDIIVHKLAMEK